MFGLFSNSSSAQISAQEVEQQLKASLKPFVLDVREPGEYQQGHIPGSVLIPLGTLAGRMNELPKGQTIVVVCRSGNRSGMGTNTLRKAGIDALNMVGGMIAWRGPVER